MRILVLDHPRPLVAEHYNDVANAPLAASLNCGYATAVIEAAGHEPLYLDFLSRPEPAEKIVRACLETDAEALLLHWVYAWDDGESVRAILEHLRLSGFVGPIFAFGLFPSLCPDELLAGTPELDGIFRGEFEGPLAAWLEDAKRPLSSLPETIPGVATRDHLGDSAPPLSGLDRLPVPHDLGRTAELTHLNVAASRGCYGRCSFCFIHPYYGVSRWRGRSVSSVLDEIRNRSAARRVDHLYFVDPNFFGPGKAGQLRARELAAGLKPLGLRFGLEARANDIEEETIALLAEAGLESVFLGLESGAQSVLDRMGKGIRLEQSRRAIEILRRHGVFVAAGFILFEPDSTLEEVAESFRFLSEMALLEHHDQTANMLYHKQIILKGSPAWRKLDDDGRLERLEHAPYEARPRFLHPWVGRLSDAMARLTGIYFQAMDGIWRGDSCGEMASFDDRHSQALDHLPAEAINSLLVRTFAHLLAAAQENQEDEFRQQLDRSCRDLQDCFQSSQGESIYV